MNPDDGQDNRAHEDKREEPGSVQEAKTDQEQNPTHDEACDTKRDSKRHASTLLAFQDWFVRLNPVTRQEIYNATLAVATVASLTILGFQSYELNRTNQLSADSVRESRIANAQSRAALQLERRAWVYPYQFNLSAVPVGNVSSVVVTVWQTNTGQTPAITKHQAWIGIAEACSGRADKDWAETAFAWSPEAAIYPGSNATLYQTAELKFTPKIRDDYLAKRTFICVNTRIAYRDVFGKEHYSDACRFHAYGNGLAQFAYCNTGNGFDSEIPAAIGGTPTTFFMEGTAAPIPVRVPPENK